VTARYLSTLRHRFFDRRQSLSVSGWSRKIALNEGRDFFLCGKKRYRGEWALIEFSRLDTDLCVKDGEIIALAANKEDIYKALLGDRYG
jgi:hypothetical protein